MSWVLQRLLHNLNLHSLLPSHWDSMAVGLAQASDVLSPEVTFHIQQIIQPISSASTSELFRKALVDIWIDLYLIKFQCLAILCVFVFLSLEEFFITGVQSRPY